MAMLLDPFGLAIALAVMFIGASVGLLLSDPPQATKASKIPGMTARRMASPIRADTTNSRCHFQIMTSIRRFGYIDRAGARPAGAPSNVFPRISRHQCDAFATILKS